MLYFLYKLSENGEPVSDAPAPHDVRSFPREPTTPSKRTSAPAFQDAFAKPGLAQLPLNAGSPKASTRASTVADKPEKRRERRSQDSTKDQQQQAKGAQATEKATLGPSEPTLLRELPFTLQGYSSTNLTFPSSTALKLPSTLPVPMVSLLHTLAEPAILYKGLAEFVEDSQGGLIEQSFRAALAKELRAYLGLVATLEGQIKRALAQLGEGSAHQGANKAGVTLKRCVIWIREPTMGLRLMSLMVEESKTKKGGELIALIHSFSLNHGDPYVMSFAERLLDTLQLFN